MTHASHEKELIAIIRKLDGITQVSECGARDLIFYHFMPALRKLYLSYYQWHLNKKPLDQEAQEILRQATVHFWLYGIDLENFLMGTFEDFNEWDRVCIQRTNIEAFNAMFQEIVSIDIEDIEDQMQRRKQTGVTLSSADLIPQNTPRSHWWWWI